MFFENVCMEDDIKIDLSRIKNFFITKEKKESVKITEEAKEAETEQNKNPNLPKMRDINPVGIFKQREFLKNSRGAQESQHIKSIIGDSLTVADTPNQYPQQRNPTIASEGISATNKQNSDENKESELKEQKNSDEISVDFSKIKEIFKKDFFSGFFAKSEENSIDFSAYFAFVKKHSTLFVLVLLLFLQFMPNQGYLPWGGMWMRMEAQNLVRADEWARDAVQSTYLEQIKTGINKQHPNLPNEKKNKLINEELEKALIERKSVIEEQTNVLSKIFRSQFQYEHDGTPYLYMYDVDPYVFLRYAENYIERGHIADKIIEGRHIDTHQFAPVSHEITPKTLHPYVLAYIHKIFSLFSKDIPIMQSTAYMPIIFMALSLIPAFFIAKNFAGNIGGFVAATMLAVHPALLSRTYWSLADTDSYSTFFPLTITWIFLLAVYSNRAKKANSYMAIAGFLTGVYAVAWGGWWHIFYFILSTLGIYLIYLIIIRRYFNQPKSAGIRNTIMLMGSYILFTTIFFSILVSFEGFYKSLFGPFIVFLIKPIAHASLWPNVYTSVEELKRLSFKFILAMFGGIPLLISVLGIGFSLFKKDANGKRDVRLAILLIIWIFSTIYAITRGRRFSMLVVPAFSIGLGIAAGVLFQSFAEFCKKRFSVNKIWSGAVLLGIFYALVFIIPVTASYDFIKTASPLINDAWWNALAEIKNNSSENAIITSWWDFGHYFKYSADRPVTFDGGSQNTPLAYWVGRMLLTDDEKEAVSILRMLDCGIYIGLEVLDNETGFTPKSMEILDKISMIERENAKEILNKYGILDSKADEILRYTHCNPPEAFLITSDDMINKAGVWARFGNWDLKNADLWLNVRKMERDKAINYLMEKYNDTRENAVKLYSKARKIKNEAEASEWISSTTGFASKDTAECGIEGNKIACKNGLVIENEIPSINTPNGRSYLKSYSYIDKNKKFKTKVRGIDYYGKPEIELSAILIPEQDRLSSILADPPLEKSMFSLLYFYQGHGLKHFKRFKAERQQTGGMIYVWKVDWNGSEENVMDAVKEKSRVEAGDTIIMNYVGWFESGEIFDSSIVNWKNKSIQPTDLLFKNVYENEKTSPLRFKLGEGKIIRGLEKDIVGMERGETKIIKVKPEDAYGSDPFVHPLGNKTLNFQVRIESIK